MCARAVCAMTMMRKTVRRAEGELRGCFAKAARASLSFCCEALVSFFQSERERKKRDFQKKSKKRDSLEELFLMQWPLRGLNLRRPQKASLKFYDDEMWEPEFLSVGFL